MCVEGRVSAAAGLHGFGVLCVCCARHVMSAVTTCVLQGSPTKAITPCDGWVMGAVLRCNQLSTPLLRAADCAAVKYGARSIGAATIYCNLSISFLN